MAQIGLIRNLSDSLIINYGNPQENNIGMIVGFKLYVLKLLKILIPYMYCVSFEFSQQKLWFEQKTEV